MPAATDFTKLVPGFEFLQGMLKNAGAGLPAMGQWIAPTLDPEELDKRISELRTVQFWLEQNARMLGATIQALEVQRMTLTTLKTMNLPLTELRESMKLRVPEAAAAPVPAPEPEPAHATAPEPAPTRAAAAPAAAPAAAKPAVTGPVDPMQWWGALTQQFTELAAGALKDSSADAAKALAGAAVKQSFDAAGKSIKKAASAPVKVAARGAKAVAPRRRRSSP
jgi:hypothetical protein